VVRESGILVGRLYDPVYLLNAGAISFFSLSILSWLLFPEAVFGKERRIANILWMLYAGPLGLIQDVLSHMRLFGIALSGAILALVINTMCGLLPAPFGLMFAPFGHLIIFLLSLLSLYIHTNRLIFLEFGTKCMSGGHHYFNPFARRT
jgi:V/A-type H+-transporting ATPase subunit I